jgi:hypothetical protein
MTSLLERIRKSQTTISMFFATILIIPFQVLILGYAVIQSIDIETAKIVFPQSVYLYLIGYSVLTVIYCIVVSLLFNPKRLVSPINVQIGSAITISILIIAYELRFIESYSAAQAFAQFFAIAFIVGMSVFFLVALGYFQYFVVRWVVALNFDSVDRLSFSINAKTEEVMSALGDEFVDVWEFSRKRDNPKIKTKKSIIWILRCRDTYGNRVILTVGSDSSDDNKSILGTVAFHTTLYSIETSKSAIAMRTSILNDVRERLRKSNSEITLKQLDSTDDHVSFKAYSHALSITCPKTEVTKELLRRIPRYYVYGIAITCISLVLITGTYAFRILDLSTYVGAALVLVIALIAEFGVPLHEELKQEVEELD